MHDLLDLWLQMLWKIKEPQIQTVSTSEHLKDNNLSWLSQTLITLLNLILHPHCKLMTLPPTSVSTTWFPSTPFPSTLKKEKNFSIDPPLIIQPKYSPEMSMTFQRPNTVKLFFPGFILRNLFSTMLDSVDYSLLIQTLWPWLSKRLHPNLPPTFAILLLPTPLHTMFMLAFPSTPSLAK